MADDESEDWGGDLISTDGEWFQDESGDWVWAYYDLALNRRWQEMRRKMFEILRSHPSPFELEELVSELEAGARRFDPAPDRPGRPPGKRPDGAQIKSLRKAKGWTQLQLAVESGEKGIGTATIKRAEAGERLSPKTIRNIAVALGVPPNTITI